MAPACSCPACSLRRLSPALTLIALGGLLLAHLLAPGFNTVALVAALLVYLGALGLLRHLLPRPADHPAPGSIFFPLLLLAVGVLLLVRHGLPNFPLGGWIANYWPLLLILWGLTRLVEHYTRPPRRRGGLSGGEIILLIFIIIFGLSFSAAYHFGHSRWANYWGINVDSWNPLDQSYSFPAAARAPLPPGAAPATVVVRGDRGDVTLIPAPPGAAPALAATLDDTVHADGQDAAQSLFQSAQPRIERQGGQWLVLPAGDARHPNLRADLKLTLPANLAVIIQTQNGDVTISDWSANLDLNTTHGDITLNRIAGNVQIDSSHDDIHLDQIQGAVAITGAGGDVSLAHVAGAASLEGEYTGNLNFAQLERGLRFTSQRTELSLAALPGSLSYDLGDLAITQARAISLHTRNEAVTIRDFTGPLEVVNRNDSVHLSASAPPADPITVSNQNADITLTLPPASRFHLDATLRNGDLHNAFSAAASAAPAPLIRLATSSGDITLASH